MDMGTEILANQEAPAVPSPALTISLIICCYRTDRWDDLRAAIDSALLQQPPVQEIVVVVDHNDSLEKRIAASYENIVVTNNSEQRGLSGARNTGIAISRGDLIVFLDDDAVAYPDMIDRLRRNVENGPVMGSVAVIKPEWLGTPARWFPDEFLWVVGCTYKGMQAGRVRNLLGAAMCVRRFVFERVGGFNSGLGRTHSALPFGCEETEFCIRANLAYPKFHFEFEPTAQCRHKVPQARTTWKYFIRRCYAEGWSKAHVAFIARVSDSLSSERVYVTRTVPIGVMTALFGVLSKSDVSGLGRALASMFGLAAAAAGYVVGRISLASNPERAAALRELPAGLSCES